MRLFKAIFYVSVYQVLMSLNTLLGVFFNSWKALHFKSKQVHISLISVVAIIALINTNILIIFGYEELTNGTRLILCMSDESIPATYWMNTCGQVHLFIYSIIPFVIITLSNSALIANVYKNYKKKVENSLNLNSSNDLVELQHSITVFSLDLCH
jgi:hypothetical protein